MLPKAPSPLSEIVIGAMGTKCRAPIFLGQGMGIVGVVCAGVAGVDGLVSDVVVASISAIVFQFHLADCLFVADLCRAA